MSTTHYLYLIIPPRQTFVFDANEEEGAIMERHAAYLRAAHERGLVVMAGPTMDGHFGASVLATADLAVAEDLARNDPAVSSGLMTYRLHPWKVGIGGPAKLRGA